MSEIFVTGHRNPDTDAIVAAISYTNLRHSIGDSEYVAARIGSVNDETQKLLDRFGFEAPVRIRDMRTQIRDLDFDRPPVLSTSVTIDTAWKLMMDDNLDALPIKCACMRRGSGAFENSPGKWLICPIFRCYFWHRRTCPDD